MEWTFKSELVNSIEQMPKGCSGFIYIIKTDEGFYIGKKNLWSRRKRKFGKKEIKAITDKRKKHWEYVTKESNWMSYTGSNKPLNEYIKNGGSYTKEILEYGFGSRHLSYLETMYQFKMNVLEEEGCYNDNILGKFFRDNLLDTK